MKFSLIFSMNLR